MGPRVYHGGRTGNGPTGTGPTGTGPTGPDWSDIRGSEASHQGSRIKDLGPCFGMNGPPRRDTDVISRLSKSTIEDRSFYIGFTMELLASRTLDLVLARMGILEEIRT